MMLEVYQEHAADLLLAAAAMAGDNVSAGEAVQESLLAFYQILENGGTITNPKAWILEDLRRRLQANPKQNESGSRFLDLPHQALGLIDEVLSKREADVVRLRNQGLKYGEIAERLGIAAGTVGTLLGRAMRKLHVKMRLRRTD
jgi:DNA-directed RNA polymerase specialized sigma24 family protein